MSAQLSDLPCEVLEKIFWYVDGRSASYIQRTTKVWNNVVEKMCSLRPFWRLCCLMEIPEDILAELFNNRYYSPEAFQDVDWKRLYIRWFTMRNVKTWPCSKTVAPSMEETPITCVKITGNCVVSGHRNGTVHLWDIQGKHISKLGQHYKMVLDLVLVDVNHKGPYYHNEHVLEHEYVASSSKDHAIHLQSLQRLPTTEKLTPLIIHFHAVSVDHLRFFDKTLAATALDNTVTFWDMTPVEGQPTAVRIQLTYRLSGPTVFIRWAGFWQNKISCICHDSTIWQLTVSRNQWMQQPLLFVPSKKTFIQRITISNGFVFQNNIVVVLTVDRFLCISIDASHFRVYPTMRPLRSYIVSVAIVGNLLALGTERGALFVYYFEKKEDLLDLNLSKPDWSEEISEASITSIDIRENNGPVIACVTSDSLYILQWTKSHLPKVL